MVQRKPQWTKLGRYDRLRGLLQIYVPRLTRGTGVYQEENRSLLRGRGFERYRYRLQPFRGCYPADYPFGRNTVSCKTKNIRNGILVITRP